MGGARKLPRGRPPGGPGGGARKLFPRLAARFGDFAAEPEAFHADGDTVVVLGTYRGRTRGGRAVEAAFAHVWTVANGRLARFRQIADTARLAAQLDLG